MRGNGYDLFADDGMLALLRAEGERRAANKVGSGERAKGKDMPFLHGAGLQGDVRTNAEGSWRNVVPMTDEELAQEQADLQPGDVEEV